MRRVGCCPRRRARHKNNPSLILRGAHLNMKKKCAAKIRFVWLFRRPVALKDSIGCRWSSWWDFCWNQLAWWGIYYLKRFQSDWTLKAMLWTKTQTHSLPPQPQDAERTFSSLHANRDVFQKWLRVNKLHPVQLRTITRWYMNCVCLVFTRAV